MGLQPDPKKRLTAKMTLQHPWLKGTASDKALGNEHAFHLKRFQYIRRLRRGVRCILAVLRLVEALQTHSKNKNKCIICFFYIIKVRIIIFKGFYLCSFCLFLYVL